MQKLKVFPYMVRQKYLAHVVGSLLVPYKTLHGADLDARVIQRQGSAGVSETRNKCRRLVTFNVIFITLEGTDVPCHVFVIDGR